MVWTLEYRENINTAAPVTILLCNTLVVRCSKQIGFLSHWDPDAVISLWRLPTVHIVTRWSGSGGIVAYLSGQLASFGALTLLVGSSDL